MNSMFDWLLDGLKVFFISMIPLGELRAGIPFGIGILKMDFFSTFLWSLAGNIFFVPFLLKFLNPVVKWIFGHSHFLKNRLQQHFLKLHTKHTEKFNEFGAIFLAIFVAVPIPVSGAWSGALLAYLFNIPFRLAFASISLGILGAGIIVLSLLRGLVWLL